MKHMNPSSVYQRRDKDKRYGAIVYQVLVDRFAPSLESDEKKHLYAYPRTLKDWHDLPKPGFFMPDVSYWSHELEFFGGDLKSLSTKLDYLKSLDIDMLYLNPIVKSLSNHKYDATDFMTISEEYGTMDDLKALTKKLHDHDILVILDGVFNHMGIESKFFQEAKKPGSPYREWFYFGDQYPQGVRLWADVPSLPELNLEHESVKDYIYRSEDSVIRTYLKSGIDGWRLDVAFDLGYEILRDLTHHAHLEKENALIVGETWNYPKLWLEVMDGVMNFTLREIIFGAITGELSPFVTNRFLSRLVDDSGIEGLLKSWVLLDNHDTVRLNHRLLKRSDQKLAQVMQFTFPGSPNLYYGTELGMTGANDPHNRAPMRWDFVHDNNDVLAWTKTLIRLHQSERALKIGDYLGIECHHLIAYVRYTDHVEETILVIINPSDQPVIERLLIPDSSLMNFSKFTLLLGHATNIHLTAGLLDIHLEAKAFAILKPVTKPEKSYTPYKRV